MQGLTYGVFGLGNKQYEHFAAVGKRIHKALGSLGATALCRRGDGDDDDDIDADFDSWQADLLRGLDASPLVSVPKVRYLQSTLGMGSKHVAAHSEWSSRCAGTRLAIMVSMITFTFLIRHDHMPVIWIACMPLPFLPCSHQFW